MNLIRRTTQAVMFVLTAFSFSWAQTKKYQTPQGFQKPPEIQRSPAAPTSASVFSYDVNAGAGTYNGVGYYEINLGLNWLLADWLTWRNALFSRIPNSGSDSINGLDSSLRLQGNMLSDSGTFGLSGFIGPGVRLANKDASAAFGEAGLMFKLGGLQLGGGVKSLYYFKTRQDATGADLPKNDNQFFIMLVGSGQL